MLNLQYFVDSLDEKLDRVCLASNGMCYATNRYILIRISHTEYNINDVANFSGDDIKFIACMGVDHSAFDDIIDIDRLNVEKISIKYLKSLVDFDSLTKKKIHLSQECKECDGTGVIDCPHCGQEMECEECKGTGFFIVNTPNFTYEDINIQLKYFYPVLELADQMGEDYLYMSKGPDTLHITLGNSEIVCAHNRGKTSNDIIYTKEV